jgi:hypothetical protein
VAAGQWLPVEISNKAIQNEERKDPMRVLNSMSILVSGVVLLMCGCNSGPKGTYTDANGAVILELKSGGKANFTFMGDVEDCTHESSGKQLTLTCKGSPAPVTVFNIHDDGSLTGPPGSFMPPLRKEK